MTDKGYCVERVGKNLWQADPTLKFNFLLSVRSPFVWFSSRTSEFDFGPNLGIFLKRTILLINWNEIIDFFMSHLC
jgi:hypothetical protein